MRVAEEFDAWADAGKDRGMEERHWYTAKYAIARMPVEAGEVVLDLGTGSGYAVRALRETKGAGAGYGMDGSPRMLENAREYTTDAATGFVCGDFHSIPLATDSIDHAFSMEAFYYAADPQRTLEEIHRVLRPSGTFFCAVNFFEESEETHRWQSRIELPMTLWSMADYRDAFRAAGFAVAAQDTIPDEETEIPPQEAFPLPEWETRDAMVDRYRRWGTLLTVGVTMNAASESV